MSKTSARPTITPGRRFFFAPALFFPGPFAGSENFSAKSKNSLRCWTRIERKCASQYLGIFWRVCRCVLASGAGGCAVWLWLSLWAVCTHSKFCFPSWFLSRCPAPAAFVLFPRVHCRLSEMVSTRDISRGAVLPACTIAGQTAAHRPARTAPRPLFRRVCLIQRQRNAISCHNIVFIFLQWATISHKKHGFQNIKGVFSHCAGAFSVGNDCIHSRTACECRKFSSVATLKVLFFRMVPCFFRFAGGIRVCSAGALLGFSEMLSRAQMGGGLFFSV